MLGALLLVFLCFSAAPGHCWTQEELDLFDLVEEIGLGENFYDILQINQVRKRN